MPSRRLVRAALGTPRIGELRDLPRAANLDEHEGVDAAMAECRLAVEGVVRPHLRDVAVDTHFGFVNALVPNVAGRRARDRGAELRWSGQAHAWRTPRRNADQSRRGVKRLGE